MERHVLEPAGDRAALLSCCDVAVTMLRGDNLDFGHDFGLVEFLLCNDQPPDHLRECEVPDGELAARRDLTDIAKVRGSSSMRTKLPKPAQRRM